MVWHQLTAVDAVNKQQEQEHAEKNTQRQSMDCTTGLPPVPQDIEQAREKADDCGEEDYNKERFEHGRFPRSKLQGRHSE